MGLLDIGVFETSYLDGIVESVFGFMVEETAITCCFCVATCRVVPSVLPLK